MYSKGYHVVAAPLLCECQIFFQSPSTAGNVEKSKRSTRASGNCLSGVFGVELITIGCEMLLKGCSLLLIPRRDAGSLLRLPLRQTAAGLPLGCADPNRAHDRALGLTVLSLDLS